MQKKAFYRLCILLFTAAYAWLCYQLLIEKQGGFTPCFSKFFFHLPCPACGTTRGILLLLQGHPVDAFRMNPNSYVVFLLILGTSGLLIFDGIRRTDSLYRFYLYIDKLLHKKILFACVLMVESIIWVHNILIGQ